MKIVIIGIAALVVLLGGGFAALKALKIGPFAPPEAEAASEAPPKLEPPRFIAVDPLVIPVFSGNQVAAQIQVTVKLETVGSANEQKLMRLLPQLTNHLYQDLYAFVPRLLREEDRLNVTVLRRRMQMVADKVAGPGIVDNVLIQSVTDTRHKDESKS